MQHVPPCASGRRAFLHQVAILPCTDTVLCASGHIFLCCIIRSASALQATVACAALIEKGEEDSVKGYTPSSPVLQQSGW